MVYIDPLVRLWIIWVVFLLILLYRSVDKSLLFNPEKKCEALGMSCSGRIATQRFSDINRFGQKLMLIVSVLLLLDSTLMPSKHNAAAFVFFSEFTTLISLFATFSITIELPCLKP